MRTRELLSWLRAILRLRGKRVDPSKVFTVDKDGRVCKPERRVVRGRAR